MKELTILMPCLNERESIAFCIREAQSFLESRGIDGEVLIADNGSRDDSARLAQAAGARVVTVTAKGYGSAIRGGIRAAEGKYIILSDCDGSYCLEELDEMLCKLREGSHLVVGDRFRGGIQKGAMPFSHRYFGVPLLSFLGRLRFRVDVKDFHCGLRGFCRETAQNLHLTCSGMEFATELIGRFADAGCRISQVPVVLRRDLRGGPGHLRTIPDGFRHLKLLLFWNRREH